MHNTVQYSNVMYNTVQYRDLTMTRDVSIISVVWTEEDCVLSLPGMHYIQFPCIVLHVSFFRYCIVLSTVPADEAVEVCFQLLVCPLSDQEWVGHVFGTLLFN